MKIIPEIIKDYKIKEEKRQKEKEFIFYPNKFRKNNRKNTMGRYTQIINFFDYSAFPPILKTKFIKHIKF